MNWSLNARIKHVFKLYLKTAVQGPNSSCIHEATTKNSIHNYFILNIFSRIFLNISADHNASIFTQMVSHRVICLI